MYAIAKTGSGQEATSELNVSFSFSSIAVVVAVVSTPHQRLAPRSVYGEHAPSTVATALTEAILAAETDNDNDDNSDSNGDSAAAAAAAAADGRGDGRGDGYAGGYGGLDDGAARPSDEYEGAPDDWDAAAGKKTPALQHRYTEA